MISLANVTLSQIVDLVTGPAIMIIDKSHLRQTMLQCRCILMDESQNKMPVRKFVRHYFQYHKKQCNLEELEKDLAEIVRVCVKIERCLRRLSWYIVIT